MSSITDQDSLDNYIFDCWIRSFENADALYEDVRELAPAARRELAAAGFERRKEWGQLYEARVQSLFKSVTLTDGVHNFAPERITYHVRFGWTLEAGPVKAFLGKTSIWNGICIRIGARSYFSGPGTIRGNAKLLIGNYTSIGEGSYIQVERDIHPLHYPATANFRENFRFVEDGLAFDVRYDELDRAKNGISIGSDVWLGRRVRLMHGITLGDGVVIAEGSLVNSDCEPFGIYAGTPARLVRFRFTERVREELLRIRWWNWPIEEIRRNAEFFGRNLRDYDGPLPGLASIGSEPR